MEEQGKVKYFQFYRSLYTIVKDLSPEDFKAAIIPLLEYAFTDKPHVPNSDRYFEAIFISNKPFVDKLQKDTENGKKGGAPNGNKNASGHGAPKGNRNAKKNKQPDKEIETETDTSIEKETDTDTDIYSASTSLEASRSELKFMNVCDL